MRRSILSYALLALVSVTTAGCEAAQTPEPARVCDLAFDTLVETTGFIKRPEKPICQARRNLGTQCSYLFVRDAKASAGGVEINILQGQASNQVEEQAGPPPSDGAPPSPRLVIHTAANASLTAESAVRVRGRVFPGLRDPSTCRLEVLQIREPAK